MRCRTIFCFVIQGTLPRHSALYGIPRFKRLFHTPLCTVVSSVRAMADCTLGGVHHRPFDLFCVRRWALYYRVLCTVTLYHGSAHYLMGRQFRCLLCTSVSYLVAPSTELIAHKPVESDYYLSLINVVFVCSSHPISLAALSHSIVLHLSALYRAVTHYIGFHLHYAATDINCAATHYIVPTCTISCRRCFFFCTASLSRRCYLYHHSKRR